MTRKPMSDPVETITVKSDEAGLRLDRWFRIHFPEVSHSYLQKLLRTGQVRVDARRVEANARLEPGQGIRVPKVVRKTPENKSPAPSLKPPMGLSKGDRDFILGLVIYEDDDVFVLQYARGAEGGHLFAGTTTPFGYQSRRKR